MSGNMTAAQFQARVKTDLLDHPPIEQMGLQPGDLYGAASAGTAALKAGDTGKALQIFAYLVLLDPTNADYHAGLAEAALASNEPAMALQSASVVVASRPTAPDGYFLSARACIGLEEPALALEDLAETERHAAKSGQTAFVAAAQKLRAMINAKGVS